MFSSPKATSINRFLMRALREGLTVSETAEGLVSKYRNDKSEPPEIPSDTDFNGCQSFTRAFIYGLLHKLYEASKSGSDFGSKSLIHAWMTNDRRDMMGLNIVQVGDETYFDFKRDGGVKLNFCDAVNYLKAFPEDMIWVMDDRGRFAPGRYTKPADPEVDSRCHCPECRSALFS
jgi:hypothetical protein